MSSFLAIVHLNIILLFDIDILRDAVSLNRPSKKWLFKCAFKYSASQNMEIHSTCVCKT